MKTPEAPWVPRWKGAPHEKFPAWRRLVADSFSTIPAVERLSHRLEPIFPLRGIGEIRTLVVTGCALFNKPHTDVVDSIPLVKQRAVIEHLASVIADSGVSDVRFVIPRGDLVRSEFRDHLHPFMFLSVEEARRHADISGAGRLRILGNEHAGPRDNGDVAMALERSGDMLEREILKPIEEKTGITVRPITWSEYLHPYLEHGQWVVQRHRSVAEGIYKQRVATRPSYASLHVLDPDRGLRRTLANNLFYVSEAMFLRDNPDAAIVNCEFADTFWRGLEDVLAREVWGDFRPYIGMVPQQVRQPWGY